MLKVLSVLGTRPEAIKMAPVICELTRHTGAVISRVCATAQHRQMLDQVLSLFHIVPDYDLNLMQGAQSPAQVAAAVLAQLEPVLRAERPDWVLVQGDTTTVMAAAITTFYAGIKIGHVEAGLRTYNKAQPFPEEGNRRIAGAVADLHFAPTAWARDNLLREQIRAETVIVTGNPVIDALQAMVRLPCRLETGPLAEVPWHKRLLLVTVHRRENFGQPLAEICRALRDIASCYHHTVHIIYPVHLNPRVWQPVHRFLGDMPGITLLPPLNYLQFVQLLKRSYLVLTDSGGLQEEAPSLGKPVLVLRHTTERPEAIAAGTARLIGPCYQNIVSETTRLLEQATAYQCMAQAVNPYGDGQAARHIVTALLGAR
ncbi:MAG: UDP-N-acetylglucosamine 2-epimerase (non-hydrolyzing) [Nitrospinae bacterium]|nr:UDP-N-acetylglucosamine 2-epimerase (non-hydrolyzing) [Nitrospinota bacterium]